MKPPDSETDFYCHGYREGRDDAYRQVRVIGSIAFFVIVLVGMALEFVA